MARAISSGLPARLSGTPAIKPAFLSAPPVNRFSISVSTGPGATALTRTPNSAPSRAAAFVHPSTACLLAGYNHAGAFVRKGQGARTANARQGAGDQHNRGAHVHRSIAIDRG